MMTWALSLTSDDFSAQNLPNNLIGSYRLTLVVDVQTNLKILWGRSEVLLVYGDSPSPEAD